MTSFNVNPLELANLLHNAAILADAPEGTHGVEYILLEVTEHKLKAYAAGGHTAGLGAIDLSAENDQGSASVVITREEAEYLQSGKAIRGTTTSKKEQIIVEISEEGKPYTTADGVQYLANLIISWKGQDFCAIQDADPSGELSDHWELVDTLVKETGAEVPRISFHQKTIAVLGKIKPPQDFVTLRPGIERTALALVGNWIIVIGDSRPNLSDLQALEGSSQEPQTTGP